ncbi:unnamed protein product [Amoebophrya sp. A25]|nr:unnamed protein product [Amoebophrya sp. A25]|eukprot:GSA25T00007508001.1
MSHPGVSVDTTHRSAGSAEAAAGFGDSGVPRGATPGGEHRTIVDSSLYATATMASGASASSSSSFSQVLDSVFLFLETWILPRHGALLLQDPVACKIVITSAAVVCVLMVETVRVALDSSRLSRGRPSSWSQLYQTLFPRRPQQDSPTRPQVATSPVATSAAAVQAQNRQQMLRDTAQRVNAWGAKLRVGVDVKRTRTVQPGNENSRSLHQFPDSESSSSASSLNKNNSPISPGGTAWAEAASESAGPSKGGSSRSDREGGLAQANGAANSPRNAPNGRAASESNAGHQNHGESSCTSSSKSSTSCNGIPTTAGATNNGRPNSPNEVSSSRGNNEEGENREANGDGAWSRSSGFEGGTTGEYQVCTDVVSLRLLKRDNSEILIVGSEEIPLPFAKETVTVDANEDTNRAVRIRGNRLIFSSVSDRTEFLLTLRVLNQQCDKAARAAAAATQYDADKGPMKTESLQPSIAAA